MKTHFHLNLIYAFGKERRVGLHEQFKLNIWKLLCKRNQRQAKLVSYITGLQTAEKIPSPISISWNYFREIITWNSPNSRYINLKSHFSGHNNQTMYIRRSEWSKCSATCGHGTQWRSVLCHRTQDYRINCQENRTCNDFHCSGKASSCFEQMHFWRQLLYSNVWNLETLPLIDWIATLSRFV